MNTQETLEKGQNKGTSFVEEMSDNFQKMLKGFEVLEDIDEKDITVATSPKTKVWEQDKVKLYRYDTDTPPTCAVPLLISYALVNRFDMMDLQPDRSFIRNLLNQGIEIYLIDWGYPTKADRYLDMSDYINGYLNDCVDKVRELSGQPKINLLGVCQGGTFSTIYTALHGDKVKNLITLVTPIDFFVEDGQLFKWSRDMDVEAIVDGYDGLVPGEFLNMGFDLLKPMSKVRKMSTMVDMMQDKKKLLNFLRMEKWINDSPSQAGACYQQFITNMYQQNKLLKGEFELDGEPVKLANIKVPVLNIYAEHDHLVPPTASIPLNDAVGSEDTTLYKFPGGHIGVFVGGRSQKELAPAVAKWIKERSKV